MKIIHFILVILENTKKYKEENKNDCEPRFCQAQIMNTGKKVRRETHGGGGWGTPGLSPDVCPEGPSVKGKALESEYSRLGLPHVTL